MKPISKSYPAKLLLFGEHTVLYGSDALAFPIGNYQARLSYHQPIAELKPILIDFLEYLKKQEMLNCLDFEAIEKEFRAELGFESSIPIGYGLGSSGALCAAIYDCFAKTKAQNSEEVRHILSTMESFFHGKSSGLDPLVCYYQSAVLVGQNKLDVLKGVDFPSLEGYQFFILDSQIKREASVQIALFKEKMHNNDFRQLVERAYIPLVGQAIQATISKNQEMLTSSFKQISRFQFEHFDFLIPNDIKTIWKKGLESKAFYLKVCGAGGGGIFLGIGNTDEMKNNSFNPFTVSEIYTFE